MKAMQTMDKVNKHLIHLLNAMCWFLHFDESKSNYKIFPNKHWLGFYSVQRQLNSEHKTNQMKSLKWNLAYDI